MGDLEIADILYKKSLDVEPRNCTRPPRFPRRWPDVNLKSPGIKPKSFPGRSHPPTPLTSISERHIHPSIHSDKDGEDTPRTPLTASAPHTPPLPPHTGTGAVISPSSEFRVFESVDLGPGLGRSGVGGMSPGVPLTHVHSQSTGSLVSPTLSQHPQHPQHPSPGPQGSPATSPSFVHPPPIPPFPALDKMPPPANPPPLPPRRPRESSLSDGAGVPGSPVSLLPPVKLPSQALQARQAPDAPILPPRDLSPPPLPPRTSTLPRPNTQSALLMRRNSGIVDGGLGGGQAPRRHMSINGPILAASASQPPSPPATSPVTYAQSGVSVFNHRATQSVPAMHSRPQANHVPPPSRHPGGGLSGGLHGGLAHNSLNRHGSQTLPTAPSRPASGLGLGGVLPPTPAPSLNRHGNQLGTHGLGLSLGRPIHHQRHGSDSDCPLPMVPPSPSAIPLTPTPRLPPKPGMGTMSTQGGHS